MIIANARRHGRDLTVVVADIDNFKALNDQLGHSAGDRALIAFTEYVEAAIRHGDVLGRLGGDEFCMILIDTSAADAAHVMERARSEIARHTHDEMPHCRLTASFGMAGSRESELIFDPLLRSADRALYRSYAAGRNCTHISKNR